MTTHEDPKYHAHLIDLYINNEEGSYHALLDFFKFNKDALNLTPANCKEFVQMLYPDGVFELTKEDIENSVSWDTLCSWWIEQAEEYLNNC